MSAPELERLRADLKHDSVLREDFQALEDDVADWVLWAVDLGYQISHEEAETLFEIHGELCDEDLEQAAGGWPDGTPPPPGEGGG